MARASGSGSATCIRISPPDNGRSELHLPAVVSLIPSVRDKQEDKASLFVPGMSCVLCHRPIDDLDDAEVDHK